MNVQLHFATNSTLSTSLSIRNYLVINNNNDDDDDDDDDNNNNLVSSYTAISKKVGERFVASCMLRLAYQA